MPESAVSHDSGVRLERQQELHGDVVEMLPTCRPATPADSIDPPRDHAGRPRAEGYSIRVEAHQIVIASPSDTGYLHAVNHARALARRGQLRAGSLSDWPELKVRGIIEGFYGEPWSHEERLRMLSELAEWRMNTYVYAPKDDPYHRKLWREPYPTPQAQHLASLVAAATSAGIEFVYAIHPGLDITHTRDDDHAALAARAAELARLGVRRFAVLFDDIPYELPSAADRARYGEGPDGAGRAQSETLARFEAQALTPLGLAGALLTVPTEYAGIGRSGYRTSFSDALPANCAVMWTGRDIVVGDVRTTHTAHAHTAFGGRDLVLWDNFPVNDFDRSRAFLGPLLGRDGDLPEAGLTGILSSPMVEYEPSRFALHTVAQWAWNPATYRPDEAAERALHDVAGNDAAVLAPLVAAASSWPPSAGQYDVMLDAVERALDRGGQPDDALLHLLAGLKGCATLGDRTALRAALAPWGAAAALTANVITTALAHRRKEASADAVVTAWEEARTTRHGIARDVARTTAESVLARPLRAPVALQSDVPPDY